MRTWILVLGLLLTLVIQATATEIDACATLNQNNTVYLLNVSIVDATDTCMTITGNNVTLDCQNRTIDGTSVEAAAIFSNGRQNLTILNCKLTDWAGVGFGVYIKNTINVSLRNIESTNAYYHIYMQGAVETYIDNVTFIGQNSTDYPAGIFIDSSTKNVTITRATIKNIGAENYPSTLGYGIYATAALINSVTVSNSTISNCSIGIKLGGNNLKSFTLANSTIEGSTDTGIVNEGGFNWTFYNNIFNNTIDTYFGVYSPVDFNSTNQTGARRIGAGNIGGNWWTNPTKTGYSDTCVDDNYDGFCDVAKNLSANGVGIYDYLPYSSNFSGDGSANVTLMFPENGTTKEMTGIAYKISLTTETPVAWCQVWDNTTGTWQADSNRNISSISSITSFPEKTLTVGSYKWNVFCCNRKNICNFSNAANLTFTIKAAGGGSEGTSGTPGGAGGSTPLIVAGADFSIQEINQIIITPVWRNWSYPLYSKRELTNCICENFTCEYISKTQYRLSHYVAEENKYYWSIQGSCMFQDIGNEWSRVPITLNIVNMGVYYPTQAIDIPIQSDLLFVTEDGVTTGVRYAAILILVGVIYVGYTKTQ